jgi:hypothetical protein
MAMNFRKSISQLASITAFSILALSSIAHAKPNTTLYYGTYRYGDEVGNVIEDIMDPAHPFDIKYGTKQPGLRTAYTIYYRTDDGQFTRVGLHNPNDSDEKAKLSWFDKKDWSELIRSDARGEVLERFGIDIDAPTAAENQHSSESTHFSSTRSK